MYFKDFPNIYYLFDIDGRYELRVVSDITTNVRFRKKILENITLFDEYDIREGETPDIIAAKIYGSSEYHWLIMLCNQRYDWVNDFPLGYHALNDFISDKYGEARYATHHYEKDGFVVKQSTPGAAPVSNDEYETRLNDSKRRIKLISPELLNAILTEFNTIL